MSTIAERLPDPSRGRKSPSESTAYAGGASVSATRVNVALTLIRAVVGVVFVAHGAQKLFLFGLDGVSGGFAESGIPLATLTGPAVTFIELLGGLALLAGALTRLASLALAAVMLGAMLFVHLPAGFFAPNGIEFTLTLFVAAVALALTGPGEYSVDTLLKRRNG